MVSRRAAADRVAIDAQVVLDPRHCGVHGRCRRQWRGRDCSLAKGAVLVDWKDNPALRWRGSLGGDGRRAAHRPNNDPGQYEACSIHTVLLHFSSVLEAHAHCSDTLPVLPGTHRWKAPLERCPTHVFAQAPLKASPKLARIVNERRQEVFSRACCVSVES